MNTIKKTLKYKISVDNSKDLTFLFMKKYKNIEIFKIKEKFLL